jgi:hypothetical protein
MLSFAKKVLVWILTILYGKGANIQNETIKIVITLNACNSIQII